MVEFEVGRLLVDAWWPQLARKISEPHLIVQQRMRNDQILISTLSDYMRESLESQVPEPAINTLQIFPACQSFFFARFEFLNSPRLNCQEK